VLFSDAGGGDAARERGKKVFFFFFYSSAPPGPNMAFYIPSSRSVGLLLFFFPKRNKKNIADIAPYIELYYSHFKTIKFSYSYFAILDGEMIFVFYLFLMLCLKKIF